MALRDLARGLFRAMSVRPLACAALLYALGGWVAYLSNAPAYCYAALAVVGGVVFFFRRNLATALMLFVLLGATATRVAMLPPSVPETDGAILAGRVIAIDDMDGYSVWTLDRARVDGARAGTNARVYVYDELAPNAGDHVSMRARIFHFRGRTNPGGYDARARQYQNGIKLGASAKTGTIIATPGGFSVRATLERTRGYLADRIDALLGERAPLAKSLLLGDRDDLSDTVNANFRDAGVAHLLSISGLHVACLAWAVQMFLSMLGASKKWATVLTGVFVFAYAAVVNFPASVVRALGMFLLGNTAWLPGNPYDSLSGTAAAFFLLTILNPLSMFSAGFVLSFMAVIGIVTLAPVLARLFRAYSGGRLRAYVLGGITVSLAAQIGVLPATASSFGTIPVYGVFANLVMVPLATVLLPVLLAMLIVAPIAPIADGLLWLLEALSTAIARLPFSVVAMPAWPVGLTAVFLATALCATTLLGFGRRVRHICLALLVPLALTSYVVGYLRVPDGCVIGALDASDADALVVFAQRNLYCVDVGTPGSPTDDYLRYLGADVDGVFLTHPHLDHAGGLAELLAVRDVPKLYLPWCWSAYAPDPGVAEAVLLAESLGARVEYLAAGDTVTLSPSVTATVLAPDRDSVPPNANAASLVLRIDYCDASAILPGDVPANREPTTFGRAQYLKAAHHGSGSANSAYMLRSVMPSVLVVSTDGMASTAQSVLDDAERLGIRVLRTDRDGAVFTRLLPDGRLEVETVL